MGPPVNISHLTGHQREAAIAVDPADPMRLFAVSNSGLGGALFAAYSTDGGSSWTYTDRSDGTIADSHDSLVQACCDPSSAFDQYGNLFLGYLSEVSPQTVELALSTDGGQSFTRLAEFPRGRLGTDQPTVVTGPDGTGQQSVWVTFRDNDTPQVMAYGAQVTGLNAVGSFTGFGLGPESRTGNFGDIADGPSGQVLVVYQSTGSRGPYTISTNLEPDGLAGGVTFGSRVTVAGTNLGDNDSITPQPDRGVDAEVGLAWDRNPSSRNFGRVYLVYTDEIPSESSNTDIFVSFSDDDGTTWSSSVRVNDDGTTNSQFLPRIAVDQTTGFVGVSWYDARNSPDNSTAEFFGAISIDGGLTFGTNFKISTGTSNQALAGGPGDLDYGDYTGLAFHDGRLHPIWADNSNSTGDNPDGNAFDVYTATVLAGSANSPPDAVNDRYTINEDQTLSVAAPGVLGNDSDPDGDSLVITGNTSPAHGSLNLNSDGSFTYTPAADFNGTDSFTYSIGDGHGGSATATVTIIINPVNDPPVANDDTYGVEEDQTLTVAAPGVLANDSDVNGDSLAITTNTEPSHGSLTLQADSSFTYIPDPDFNGTDSFTYTVSDGHGDSATATVTIIINPVNDPPAARDDAYRVDEDHTLTAAAPGVLANDSDPDGDLLAVIANTNPAHGGLSLNGDGSFSYIPNPTFSGADNFTYTISDGNGGSATATATITVDPVNDAPTLDPIADLKIPMSSGTQTVNLTGISTGAANEQQLTVTAVSDNTGLIPNPTVLYASPATTGALQFTPVAGASGTAIITVTVQDDGGTACGGVDTISRQFTVTVVPNGAPVINDRDLVPIPPTVPEGSLAHLTGHFTDADPGQNHRVAIDWGDGSSMTVSNLPGGQTNFSADHVYVDDDPSGTSSDIYIVTVTVTDSFGVSASAATQFTVLNVAPTVSVTGPGAGVPGQILSFSAIIIDPGIRDTHVIAWDFGDGTVLPLQSSTNAAVLAPRHAYERPGTYTVKVTVRDDDGGITSIQKRITIHAVSLVSDPLKPGTTDLFVGGTPGADQIFFRQLGPSQVLVSLNGSVLGPFGPVQRILVYGGAGNDRIQLDSRVSIPALLDGGPGDDILVAGSANDVLVGGDGNDSLYGGAGSDLLIGGQGADLLTGSNPKDKPTGGEGDLLIAGSTIHDSDPLALSQILAEWTSGRGYADRVRRLQTGQDGLPKLNATSVVDDSAIDQLFASRDLDWLIFSPGQARLRNGLSFQEATLPIFAARRMARRK